MSSKIPHHMRRYRLSAGLTQGEMAFLVGGQSPTTVCHYERFSRKPDLRAALAYEVIFGVPARELFPGIYKEVEKQVTNRAHRLNARLVSSTCRTKGISKERLLRTLVAPKARAPESDV